MKCVNACLAALFATTAMAGLLGGHAWAAEYELNFAGPYFDRHTTVVTVFQPWIEELKTKTGGKLDITYFAPNTICPEPEILSSVEVGTVDMGGNNFGRNPGRLTPAELALVPMLNDSPRTTAMAWYDVTQKYSQHFPEFKGEIKLLFVWSSALSQIHTTSKPIRSLEDIKGMKIICWNPSSVEAIKALGGTPMMQSNADTYLALERGMADGVLAPFAPLKSQKLTEVLRYHTVCDISLTPFWGGINREVYDELDDETRAILDAMTGVGFSGVVGQSLEDGAAEDVEWIKQEGKSEIIVLDDAERARWKDATRGILDVALEKNERAGIPRAEGQAMYDYFVERIAWHNANSK